MTLLLIARDVAGAHAVGIIGQQLAKSYPLHVLAEDVAIATLPSYGLEISPLDEPLAARFERIQPRLLLSGTSIQPGLEKSAIALARQFSIPSLALLDSWTNYASRFADLETGEPLRYLPDKLALFDESARDELLALNIPPQCLIVTGNPYFARLAEAQPAKSREVVREELNILHDARMVTFLSEPLADEWYEKFANNYPEADEIAAVLRLCAEIAQRSAAQWVIKLHPIEDPALAKQSLAGLSGQLVGRYDPLSLVMASDVVLGLNTNLLIESALVKVPTYSILLDEYKARGRVSIAERFGGIGLLRHAEAIEKAILGSAPPTLPPDILYQGATEAIMQVIEKMVLRD